MSDVAARVGRELADRYRLERELGQGGMATVWLAEDVKHGRKVAIKVLHPELSAVIGGERFLAEIRTTAQLQHPHILGLIDSGTADGLLYYVMPWVSGESLRTKLDREQQLSVDEALRLAKEVASALDYAHRQGVVHRDIKPENILLQDGSALVADFGIALAVQQAGGQRLTQTGMSLGTPHYMAPEQAMGERAITARSDVYALGVMTYEMLAGEPPFTGPNSQSIVAKVLTETPPALRPKRPTVPAHVEAALEVALQKLPADRFGSAAKFAEALSQAGAAVAPPAPAKRTAASPSSPILRALAGGGALLCIALAWRLGRSSVAPAPAWTQFTQLTDASGVETSPTLSPDGESFAYASDARGTWDVYAQRVGGRNPVLVAGDTTVDEEWPAYSPDGSQIAYAQTGSGIFLVGATGESPRRLTTFGSNPSWSPDGRRIVFGSEAVVGAYNVNLKGSLWVVDASGGEPKRLAIPGATDMYQPAWSPSGTRIAFWSATGGQRDIETVPAAGGPRTTVTDDAAVDWAPTWSADGRWIYFASDRGGTMGLWRIAMDEASGGPRGTPEAIAAGVDVAMDQPHLSRDGTAILFRSKVESVNPAAIAFDPATGRAGAVTLLQHRTGILVPTDASPDGRWLALNNTPDRRQDIFVMRTDGSALTRLTDDEARDYFPTFTPDGRSLAWFTNQTGQYQGVSMLVDGSGRRVLTDLPGGASFTRFAPDGTRLLVQPVTGPALIGSPPWPLTEKNAAPLEGTTIGEESLVLSGWSPDGRLLSGLLESTALGARGHAIYDIETHRARRLNSDSHGYTVAWLPGGRQVAYFTDAGRLVLQDVATLARREVDVTLPAPPNFDGIIVAAPDGRTLYYGASEVQANIWLVRRAGAPGGTQ